MVALAKSVKSQTKKARCIEINRKIAEPEGFNMKIGRNAPCPCGSGKKYKKCCLLKAQAETLTRSILHRTSSELVPKMLKYAKQNYGEEAFVQAWSDFSGDELEADFTGSPYTNMFIAWFLFQWIPDDEGDFEGDEIYPSPHTIGSSFLQDNASRLDSLSLRYLEAALREPLSFWQIEAIEPGRGLLANDLFLGRERFIEDVTGSEHMHEWDIILASIMEVDGTCVFNITPPFCFPARAREHILDAFGIDFEGLKEDEALNELFHIDLDLIWFYQDLADDLFSPTVPELQTTDGEQIVFTNSIYQFNPSDRLTIVKRLAEIKEFESEPDSTKDRTRFVWTEPAGDHTLLDNITKGRIEVRRKYIETESNSAQRDNYLRDKLMGVLSDLITHRKTSSRPFDSAKASAESGLARPEGAGALNLDDLPPEAQSQLKEHMEKIYMNWADTRIPVLGNRTPREAVADPEDRKRVIHLINDWGNMQSRTQSPQFVFDFNNLRKALGLPLE